MNEELKKDMVWFEENCKEEFDTLMEFCIFFYDDRLTIFQNFKDIIPFLFMSGYKKAFLSCKK